MLERKIKPLLLSIGGLVVASFGSTAIASSTDVSELLGTAVDDDLLSITGSDEGEGECGEGQCGEGDEEGEGECGEGQCGEGDDEEGDEEEEA